MTDLKKLERALRDEQAQLHKQLTELGIQDITAPEDWVATPEEPIESEADENIVADRSEEWIERRGEVAALETRYNNIVRALEKIKVSAYGMCEICQQPIEEDRLEANPAARTCITHLNEESQLGL